MPLSGERNFESKVPRNILIIYWGLAIDLYHWRYWSFCCKWHYVLQAITFFIIIILLPLCTLNMTETQRIVLRRICLFEISFRLGKLLKWELSWKRRLHSERRRRKSRSWRRWPSKPGKNELASELLQVNRAVFKTNRGAYFNCKVQLFHTAITAQLLLVHREYVKSSYASVKTLLVGLPGKVCAI